MKAVSKPSSTQSLIQTHSKTEKQSQATLCSLSVAKASAHVAPADSPPPALLAANPTKNLIPMHNNAQANHAAPLPTTNRGVPPWGGHGFVCQKRMFPSNSLRTNRLQGPKYRLRALSMSANPKTFASTTRHQCLAAPKPSQPHKNAQAQTALSPPYPPTAVYHPGGGLASFVQNAYFHLIN
jgi:hypothetical protein